MRLAPLNKSSSHSRPRADPRIIICRRTHPIVQRHLILLSIDPLSIDRGVFYIYVLCRHTNLSKNTKYTRTRGIHHRAQCVRVTSIFVFVLFVRRTTKEHVALARRSVIVCAKALPRRLARDHSKYKLCVPTHSFKNALHKYPSIKRHVMSNFSHKIFRLFGCRAAPRSAL